ncbi:hypothetical protein EUTSA_v10000352mg [Eutrema salsugineum]|uniref:Uncharacterized protein n=1 Tax=Eutrema salsugineum TaxID=72664 RepID=V4L7E9_EUTSA|nr:hypothetical protein EUTSA_v10000352mg [Eutrema salsugineum]
MEECERKLMEDDLLENDDLLGEELDDEIADVSQERTISETPIPSPTSRRTRSHKSSKTSHLAGEDISKMNGNPPNTGSRKLVEPKRRIPRSPKGVGVAISRKLKPFKSRTSPMKKSGPTLGSAKGKNPKLSKNFPRKEESTHFGSKIISLPYVPMAKVSKIAMSCVGLVGS